MMCLDGQHCRASFSSVIIYPAEGDTLCTSNTKTFSCELRVEYFYFNSKICHILIAYLIFSNSKCWLSFYLIQAFIKLNISSIVVEKCKKIYFWNIIIMIKIGLYISTNMLKCFLCCITKQNINCLLFNVSRRVTRAGGAAGARWLESYGCCHLTPLPPPSRWWDPLKIRWPQQPPSPLPTELHAERNKHAC